MWCGVEGFGFEEADRPTLSRQKSISWVVLGRPLKRGPFLTLLLALPYGEGLNSQNSPNPNPCHWASSTGSLVCTNPQQFPAPQNPSTPEPCSHGRTPIAYYSLL